MYVSVYTYLYIYMYIYIYISRLSLLPVSQVFFCPGLMNRSVTIDVLLNGSHEEDIILGPALLAKLKTLGFEHMVNEYITF